MILSYKDSSFGIIFSNNEDCSRVIKVFKGFHHPETDNDGYNEAEYNLYRGNVCASEIEAYQTSNKFKELNKVTPTFYGNVEIEQILDENGIDVSGFFLREKNYSLSRVYGESKKWKCWMSDFKEKFNIESSEVIDKFTKRGIYANDADIIVHDLGFEVIDISMHDSSHFAKIHSAENYDYSALKLDSVNDSKTKDLE